jgi:hypothetical protein
MILDVNKRAIIAADIATIFIVCADTNLHQ